jgi:rhodanese-related sulfurtransferase
VAKASPSPPGSAPAAPSAAAGSAGKGAPGLLARFPPHPDRPFVEIAGSDALWAHGQGVPFLDARRTKVFEEGHVAGARPFAVWESDVDQKVFAFQDEVPSKDRPVVLYCSGGDCEDSHMLAEKMFGAGFTNVLVYRDGWPDWQKRGGPARTGTAP